MLVTNNERGTGSSFKPAKTSRDTRTSRDRRHYSRTSPATQPTSRTHPIRCMTTSAASVLRLKGLQFTSAEAQGGLEKFKFFEFKFSLGRAPSRGKVPATRCAGPRGFRSTLTRQFHANVDHCDDSFMQQAQGRGFLSWDPSFLQGVFLLLINQTLLRSASSVFTPFVLFSFLSGYHPLPLL